MGQSLDPLQDATGVDSVDISADIDNLLKKLDKLSTLYEKGRIDSDLLRYIPGMSKIMYQGQIDWIQTKKAYASSTYTDKQILEFSIELTKNHYMNFSNMVLCLPITFRKSTNKAQAIDVEMITVNDFFAHWIKDTSSKRYGDDIAILPINTTLYIYRYSEAMLKHLPDEVLETFQHELLYSKKKVIIKGNAANSFNDRRNHIAAAARNSHTDDNIEDRIAKFNDDNALSATKVYRIPLRYLVDVGLVNFPTAFNTKFTFNLEQNRNKLFESRDRLANLAGGAAAPLPTGQPDADIFFHGTPYMQYEQIKLNDTFNKYVTKALQSKRVLRTGIKPTPFQKTFEINTGIQSLNVEFKGANRQFSFIETSLVSDKGEQHNNVYDSYNAELAATRVASVQLENLNNKYGELKKKYDLTDEHDKYEMYRNFVAWATGGGSSVGPLTEYSNNDVYKELTKYEKYYKAADSDEKLYVDLRRGRGYTKELEKIVKKKKTKKGKMVVNRRNNIVLVKRDTTMKVTLPNGRTFYAKYKHVNRHYLPGGTTIQIIYRGRPVRGCRPTEPRPRRRAKPAAAVRGRGMMGRGIGDVAKTIATNPYVQEFGKGLLTKGRKSLQGLYRKATKRIKNKHLRSIAQSDIANMVVNEGVNKGIERLI